ncbi:MAG: nucleotidyltransferase domain-containing protein [Myxococcota bacterium]
MRDDRLTDEQRTIALRALAEESTHRHHLVVHLSGAHAYGFPSPDSDVDIKALHVAPTRALLGFEPPPPTANRLEILDGIEIDYTSNELSVCVRGLLKGDGNMLERVFSQAWVGERDPRLDGLAEHAKATLSQRLHRHYHGFARSQFKAVQEAERPSAKKALYVLRTALTGTHLLLERACEPDLTRLHERYGFPEVDELVQHKQRGETHPLDDDAAKTAAGALTRAFETLDDALRRSPLPAEPDPKAVAALEAWLIATRLAEVD